jgi:hypothetical protein
MLDVRGPKVARCADVIRGTETGITALERRKIGSDVGPACPTVSLTV